MRAELILDAAAAWPTFSEDDLGHLRMQLCESDWQAIRQQRFLLQQQLGTLSSVKPVRSAQVAADEASKRLQRAHAELLHPAAGSGRGLLDYLEVQTCSSKRFAVCGLTEEQAREQGANVDIYRSSFRPMKNTLSGNPGRSFMKLVVDRDSDRILGMHLAGRDSAEIMQGFAVALKMGARKADFDATVGIHPSSAEELVTMRTPVQSA